MTYQELAVYVRTTYAPALTLEALCSSGVRRVYRRSFGALALVAAVLIAAIYWSSYAPLWLSPQVVFGVGIMSAGLWLLFTLLDAFYNSYYFLDVAYHPAELKVVHPQVTFEAASIVFETHIDATKGFILSSFGLQVLERLGFSTNDLATFLTSRTTKVETSALTVEAPVSALSYAKAIYAADEAFAHFLFTHAIQAEDFLGACRWVSDMEMYFKQQARWWGRSELEKIEGLGISFAYGQTHGLRRFAAPVVYSVAPEDAGVVEEVSQLEGILARTQGSNALIVAALGSGEMDTVYGLVGHIQSHQAPEVLRDKQIYQLEAGALIDAAHGDKSTFENAFNAVMDEAAAAGNVIVLFDDLPGFLENAHHIGSDAAALLYRYLSMPGVQIIALADKRRFGEGVEQNAMLMEGFEIVHTHEKDERALIGILQNEVLRVEAASKVFFTYQAVAAVVTSAERYFTEGEPLDKAKDLLEELPAAAPVNRIITKDTVLTFVEKKTGVPQEGTLEAGERDKLLTLEKTLHERVVGQDEAIDAIANTMRRARAGLRNENRPMGSFLFLGPTGVGKTETAKALQDIFFGAETPMLRLDMSEYTGPDALERLTGSFGSGKQGVLVEMLRAQQYGVLLLDEFEKASSEVHNLFLQVLDEGFFSDMSGKKVNARNVIIIATSNAGSDTIFALTEAGKDLAAAKNEFIDGLVKSGIFRPELINRFDGTILFHPLGEAQIAQIATLTAKKLAATLKAQGLELVINNDLTNYLAREGFDRQFGARAMNRVLQEKVEKLLATELIGGAIAKGSRIEFIQAPDPHELSLRVAA